MIHVLIITDEHVYVEIVIYSHARNFLWLLQRMSQIFIAMSSRHVHVFVSDYRIDSVVKIIQ